MNKKNGNPSRMKSKLALKKQILLDMQINKLISNDNEPRHIPQRTDLNPPPLSFAQNRLWFLDQFDPGNTAYNILSGYHFTGPLNIIALEQSFNELIKRHEILRTTFRVIGEEPVQWIADTFKLPLTIIDLRDSSEADQINKYNQYAKTETKHQFNLAEGPLIRTSLIKLEKLKCILLLNMHHIITDGWSKSIFWKEISTLYNSLSIGDPSPLPVLPIQYADFSVWQRNWLRGGEYSKQLGFWKEKLDGFTHLDLPTDYPRPHLYTYDGAYLDIQISQEVTNILKKISVEENSTLFMTLLSAYKVLVHRYTNVDDIVIGTSIANRNQIDIENLIGFFINALVIRSDLSNNPTFRNLLNQVRRTTLDAYSNQDIPFEKLVEELQTDRDLSRNPFFQTTFLLQNLNAAHLDLSNIESEKFMVESETSKFDLSFTLHEINSGILTRITYNTNLFSPSTVKRLAVHYQNILTAIARNPDQKIGYLSLYSQDELHKILVNWNERQAPFPKDICIHQMFEECVEKTPRETSVVNEDKEISYLDFNKKANRLAHLLLKNGIGPEQTVGICMDRSIEMLVAVMAILKAGGVYVPLDSSFPEERLLFLVEDSKCKLLITNEITKSYFSKIQIPIVVFSESNYPSNFKEKNPECTTSQENLAYIMYTSGSSGKPKGVQISHNNILGLLHGYQRVTLVGDRRIGTTVAPFNFDTSVEEIFSTLCFGGTLHIIHPDDSTNSEYMSQYLINNKINITYVVPDVLIPLAEQLKATGGKLDLKCLITGLAPKKEGVLQLFRELSSDLRIINAYGPTEVTYGATGYDFIKSQDHNRDVPIGIPFPNYQVFVVNKHNKPVPIGVTGELLIGGSGVSRGYYGRPRLTAENFIPDPFSGQMGSRLYKSGDLTRYLPDGNIEFLGREDGQVKLRGYRIELGEIESVLTACSAVKKAVVIFFELAHTDARLAAYVEIIDGETTNSSNIREFISKHLPHYMIPNHIITLETIPLFPNGKVNKAALPLPDFINPEIWSQFQPPESNLEKLIAQIWKDIIGVKRVGINDNFFELGGHSLLATQIASRIRNYLKIELPLRVLFQESTVAGLTKFIRMNEKVIGQTEEIARITRNILAMSPEKLKEEIIKRKGKS